MPDILDDGAESQVPLAEATLDSVPSARDQIFRRGVGSALTWLALPVLGEQVLNLLVGLTDLYLAGTVGKEATAALGISIQVSWLVWLLFSFVGTGTTALVSRHVGQGDYRQANHFCNQSLTSAMIMGVVSFLLLQVTAPFVPRALGLSHASADLAVTILRIDSLSYLLVSVAAIGFACLRGVGDTRTPLYVMILVNLVNMLVSAVLVFGWLGAPRLGMVGIVAGTVVARTLGGLIVLVLLFKGRSGLRMQRREMRLRRDSLGRLLKIGLPAGLDGLLLWIGQFAFLGIISRLATGNEQSVIVAAHFIGIRVEALSYLPALAWATAASTTVGQYLGAKKPARALRSGHLAALQGGAMCLVMGVVYFVFARPIYQLFNAGADFEDVARVGVPALRLLAFFQIPCALMIIYANALRGAGDSRYPLLFTAVSMFGLRLPLAYLCGIVWEGGLTGAWVGMCLDMTARALFNGIRFARGRWRHIEV